MARNSLLCADVPLRNYSLTHCGQWLYIDNGHELCEYLGNVGN